MNYIFINTEEKYIIAYRWDEWGVNNPSFRGMYYWTCPKESYGQLFTSALNRSYCNMSLAVL